MVKKAHTFLENDFPILRVVLPFVAGKKCILRVPKILITKGLGFALRGNEGKFYDLAIELWNDHCICNRNANKCN